MCLWFEYVPTGPKFDSFMEQLRSDLAANPPLVGAFKPSKGALCVSKFSDGLWYDSNMGPYKPSGPLYCRHPLDSYKCLN